MSRPLGVILPPAVADQIRRTIRRHRQRFLRVSHEIGADPELAFEEHRAAERVGALLEEFGFATTRGAYGLDTAVEGVYGRGDMVVVVVGEYDALPGVGHACGHNVIAAAGLAAAVGLRAVADRLDLQVRFVGAPAEELGGGKIHLLQAGAWDEATYSLMMHPTGTGQPRTVGATTQAFERLAVTFRGRAAHGAAAPWEGINAADAATLTEVGLGLLRRQLPRDVTVGSFVVEAGRATNVIPDLARVEVEIRALVRSEWNHARERVRDVVAGAGRASGCESEVVVAEAPYEPLVNHPALARIFDEVMETFPSRSRPHESSGYVGGSTDMGNVSQYVPSIHPMVSLIGATGVPHHEQFAVDSVGAPGDDAVLVGGVALALTAAAAAHDPQIRGELLRAQRERRGYAEWSAARA